MKLIDLLQGKWLGHPLHSAVVHVPIGLWLAAAVFDTLAFFELGPPALPRLSFYCVIGGMLGAFVAVPSGAADWSPIKKDKPAWKLGLAHLMLNLVALFIWAANFGLRLPALASAEPITRAILATSLAGALLLFVSGYLGGRMVFTEGTSVGRQSKEKWSAIARHAGSRVPEE